ncbi:MAG: hypothetical protein DMD82_04445 [Candidatus Rokuibacteriota bacterium]|nr:MAG: hypothetical protein DMD82_04445 [Candidatus Rokubacteria bacterium]
MRTSAPRAVGEILPAAVPQVADRLLEQAIRRGWRSLVGPEVARRTQPGTLSGGGLQVVVDNSPWCQEITLRSPEILTALAREFGPARVRSLKVTLGRLDADPRPALREPAPPEHRVTDAERRTIDALLTPIADRDLRDSMRRLLVKTRRFA